MYTNTLNNRPPPSPTNTNNITITFHYNGLQQNIHSKYAIKKSKEAQTERKHQHENTGKPLETFQTSCFVIKVLFAGLRTFRLHWDTQNSKKQSDILENPVIIPKYWCWYKKTSIQRTSIKIGKIYLKWRQEDSPKYRTVPSGIRFQYLNVFFTVCEKQIFSDSRLLFQTGIFG